MQRKLLLFRYLQTRRTNSKWHKSAISYRHGTAFAKLPIEQLLQKMETEIVRNRIIEIASEMFLKYGVRSVSIDEVCKQLSISKKTFYVYFKQKEDLVDAFITRYEEEKENELIRALGKGNAIDDLLAFMRFTKNFISLCRKSPALFFDLEKYYYGVMEKHYRMREEKVNKAFNANLKKGIEEGLYRSDLNTEMLCLFFRFHQRSLVYDKLKKEKDFSKDKFIHFFIELIARYAMTPEGWKYLLSQTKDIGKDEDSSPCQCDIKGN